MREKSFRLLLIIFFIAGLTEARGAVILLTNGDRLSGEIVAETENSVTIKMAVGGAQVTLPRSALKAPEAAVASKAPKPQATPAVAQTQPEKPAGVSKKAPVNAGAPPLAQIQTSKKGEPKGHEKGPFRHRAYSEWVDFWEDNAVFRFLAKVYPLMDWNNQINMGMSLDTGKTDLTKIDMLFKTEKRTGKFQSRFQLQYEFDETKSETGVETTTRDWWRGNARFRYDYVKAFFVQANTNYQRRLEKGIYHEADQLVGIGYRWLDTERLEGSITPSVGFGYRDNASTGEEWNWLTSFQQDFRITLTDRVKMTQETIFTYEPVNNNPAASAEIGELAVFFRTGLENQLNERLSLILRYEFNYDERIPEARGQKTHGIRFNIGAKF